MATPVIILAITLKSSHCFFLRIKVLLWQILLESVQRFCNKSLKLHSNLKYWNRLNANFSELIISTIIFVTNGYKLIKTISFFFAFYIAWWLKFFHFILLSKYQAEYIFKLNVLVPLFNLINPLFYNLIWPASPYSISKGHEHGITTKD